jgi:hypothetical protein
MIYNIEISVEMIDDFDNEVIDVFIKVLIDGIEKDMLWVKGFDDTEWEEANELVSQLKSKLDL